MVLNLKRRTRTNKMMMLRATMTKMGLKLATLKKQKKRWATKKDLKELMTLLLVMKPLTKTTKKESELFIATHIYSDFLPNGN